MKALDTLTVDSTGGSALTATVMGNSKSVYD